MLASPERLGFPGGLLVIGAAGVQLLAVLVPGVDPAALAAGESVARGAQDVTDFAYREGVQFLALGIAGIVPAAVLDDVERLAVGYHLALTGAEGINFLAVLVIDIVP